MPDREDAVEGRRASPALVAGLILALAAIIFIAQNRDEIDVDFLFWTFTARVWTALVISGVLSILAAELLGRYIRHERRRRH